MGLLARGGLSQTFFDRYANCARPQHSLTFDCGFGFQPVRFLSQVESSWARQSASSPKTVREKTLRQARKPASWCLLVLFVGCRRVILPTKRREMGCLSGECR